MKLNPRPGVKVIANINANQSTKQLLTKTKLDGWKSLARGISSKIKFDKTRSESMFAQNQIIACVVKQYGTGIYRSCVSLNKGNVICLSTHDDEQAATETINQFWQFWEACPKGEVRRPEDVALFMKSMSGEIALAA